MIIKDDSQSNFIEKPVQWMNPKTLSKVNTSISNFSVQYNFQSIAIALLVMSSSVCTSNDEDCRDGEQAEW